MKGLRKLTVPFICPACGGALSKGGAKLTCLGCKEAYPIRSGIPDFVGKVHDFYDESELFSYTHEVKGKYPLKTRLALFFADDNFATNLRFQRKMIRRPGSVLDLGCGGGNTFYSALGEVTGVDLTLSNLKRAALHYDRVARADVLSLPFPKEAFDYVVSTDLLEHLPLAIKQQALEEMKRVLKRSGRMIHIFPVDNRHPLTRWAKGFPELYQQVFIQQDGHAGLETAEAVMSRMDRLGMERLQCSVQNGVIWPKGSVEKYLGQFPTYNPIILMTVAMAKFLRSNRYLNQAANVPCWIGDKLLTPWCGLDYITRFAVCYVKL